MFKLAYRLGSRAQRPDGGEEGSLPLRRLRIHIRIEKMLSTLCLDYEIREILIHSYLTNRVSTDPRSHFLRLEKVQRLRLTHNIRRAQTPSATFLKGEMLYGEELRASVFSFPFGV